MSGNGRIGMDGAGMKVSSGSEKRKPRLTRLVEPSESGIKVISRSRAFGSAYDRRRRNKKVSLLLVCTAAIIIVSAVAVAAFGNSAQTKVPARQQGPPPLPYYVIGYVTDSGANPVPFCTVTISRLATGNSSTVLADDVGFYNLDISVWVPAYAIGDVITVVANTTTLTGTNTGVVSATPYIEIDVTVSGGTIPEFTDIAIPIAGMLGILAVARVASNRTDEE